MEMKVIGIIPARWSSTRFPGKPLVKIGNKTMIQRVYEQSKKAIDYVLVATDDLRIVDEVKRFNGQVVMTGDFHKSGTDRCAEAIKVFETQKGLQFDIIVNIQGDEPFIQPEQILQVVDCFKDESTQIATLIKRISNNKDLNNPNNPKVVLNSNNEAIYFSRSTIPYIVNVDISEWLSKFDFFEHLGLYAYKKEILEKITTLEPSSLEIAESLEQNRWIENGFKIKVAETGFENISIDTEEDLKAILDKGMF
jgi:3-deoxy-manno-octulosonate cytidylyltransferase (CMP-KDO synthetase)